MTTEQNDNQERMEHTLGEVLLRARKANRKTIEEVSEATRIHAKFLRALETDNFEKLPAEVFVRGFIRIYASYLGLDPDDTYRHYTEQENVELKKPVVKQYQSDVIDDELMDRTSIFIKKKKSKVLPVMILLAILILFYILGVLFKTEDELPDLPATTDILTAPIENIMPETPDKLIEQEQPPPETDPEASDITSEAAEELPPPVKSPKYTKREIPGREIPKTAAILEEAPPPLREEPTPVEEETIPPAAEKQPGPVQETAEQKEEAPTGQPSLPITVKVATKPPPTETKQPSEEEPIITFEAPDDLL